MEKKTGWDLAPSYGGSGGSSVSTASVSVAPGNVFNLGLQNGQYVGDACVHCMPGDAGGAGVWRWIQWGRGHLGLPIERDVDAGFLHQL